MVPRDAPERHESPREVNNPWKPPQLHSRTSMTSRLGSLHEDWGAHRSELQSAKHGDCLEEGTSYTIVLGELLRELAMQYLDDKTLGVVCCYTCRGVHYFTLVSGAVKPCGYFA